MPRYPEPIDQLIETFTTLPGVGRKTAERFVFYLLKQPKHVLEQFNASLSEVQQHITTCRECYTVSLTELCDICSDTQRDHQIICVVAESSSVFALEQTKAWPGVYHVLGGTVNQLEGIGSEQLHIEDLAQRVQRNNVKEITIATNPDIHGETTAMYVRDALKALPVTITRLARGLPSGADIEYADDVTLGNALQNRKPM